MCVSPGQARYNNSTGKTSSQLKENHRARNLMPGRRRREKKQNKPNVCHEGGQNCREWQDFSTGIWMWYQALVWWLSVWFSIITRRIRSAWVWATQCQEPSTSTWPSVGAIGPSVRTLSRTRPISASPTQPAVKRPTTKDLVRKWFHLHISSPRSLRGRQCQVIKPTETISSGSERTWD